MPTNNPDLPVVRLARIHWREAKFTTVTMKDGYRITLTVPWEPVLAALSHQEVE